MTEKIQFPKLLVNTTHLYLVTIQLVKHQIPKLLYGQHTSHFIMAHTLQVFVRTNKTTKAKIMHCCSDLMNRGGNVGGGLDSRERERRGVREEEVVASPCNHGHSREEKVFSQVHGYTDLE